MIIESYKINILDLLILGPLVYGAYRGWVQGFITQGFSLAVLLLGIIAAIRFSGFAADVIFPRMRIQSPILPIIFFILIFSGVIYLTEFLAKVVGHMVENLERNMVNRSIGAGIGFIKFIFIVGITIVIFELLFSKLIINLPLIRDDSVMYKAIYNLIHFVFNFNITPVY